MKMNLKFRHARQKTTLTVLSPRRLALWPKVRDKRKINPVQILHGIGLNRHTTIHLRIVEGVQDPQGILQIMFQNVRQRVIQLRTLEQTNKSILAIFYFTF